MTCGWFAMGASLWAMLRGLGLDADLAESWSLYTAIVAMAVVIGFVSLIPGGLFAREAVFTGLLGPLVGGDAVALIVAAAMRFTWLMAEVAISIILYGAGWMRKVDSSPNELATQSSPPPRLAGGEGGEAV